MLENSAFHYAYKSLGARLSSKSVFKEKKTPRGLGMNAYFSVMNGLDCSLDFRAIFHFTRHFLCCLVSDLSESKLTSFALDAEVRVPTAC